MTRFLIAMLLLFSQETLGVKLQETLRVKVSLVTVGARVTDSRGRPVLGLKEQDFAVFDDGVEQKIDFFSSEEQPITLGILLDRSFSMSYNAKLERAKESARALVRATHSGSEYFYYTFDDQVRLAADFTSDPERMQAAIQQTALGGGTSLYDAVVEGIAMCSRAQLPRQAIVIISDGADMHSKHELQETMRIVRESEMQIYTIGYFGPEEDRLFRRSGPKIQLSDDRTIDNPRDVLQRIAKESGAESFFPRNDAELAKAVDDITNDLRTQYTLAFYPQPENREGNYHQLRVTVRTGRYNVRSRPGYGTLQLEPAVARRANSRAFESKVERRNGRVFYHENFTDSNSGWPDRLTAKYAPEGYRLEGEDVVAVNGPAFRNFRADVSLTTETGGGLVFRQSDEGYYAFAVFPDYAKVIRVEALKATELSRWPLSSTNASPLKIPLKIEVRCDGADCAFYRQDALIGRVSDTRFPEGRIGLYLSGKGSALFNELTVEAIR
jgi:Ca-activated chloride channel family protein